MNLINKWLDKLDNFFAYISAATLFLMMFWIFVDVILRSFFNLPIIGTLEITGEYLLPIIVFFAISYTQKHKGHVNVDLIEKKLSKGLRKIIRLFSNLVCLFMYILLGILNFQQALEYFSSDIRSISLLNYPMAPALIIVSIGILLFSTRLLVESINIIRDKEELENNTEQEGLTIVSQES